MLEKEDAERVLDSTFKENFESFKIQTAKMSVQDITGYIQLKQTIANEYNQLKSLWLKAVSLSVSLPKIKSIWVSNAIVKVKENL